MEGKPTQLPTQQQGDGKYKILKRLAVGGMAEIFLAEAANIHGFRKKVVIKRMLPQYAGEQVYIDMFLDEARLVARLNHPSVVQVFDIGEDSEGVFFTMEYVEGRDLSEILGTCYRASRKLSFSEVLAIAIPTAEGLHHAHEARDDHGELINLIHRDVSPSNVIVTNAGRVKLLDFGVAKSKSQSRETTGVSLKGKFGYMAPEQCEGLAIDRRCDIYSFGVLLWELFTGKRLHGGGNEPQVLVKIMTEDPPAPSTKRPDIPPELDALVLKALARKRDDRYSTMQELIVDMDKFMTKSGTHVSSRTLSTMLVDIFAEERPTVAMAVPTPSAPPAPGKQPTPELPAVSDDLDEKTSIHTPSPGLRSAHAAPGSAGGHPAPGSAGGHPAPGSAGGHPAPGSAGGHPAPGSAGGHPAPGSAGGHPAPGSSGGHQAPAAAQSTGGHQPPAGSNLSSGQPNVATPSAYVATQQTGPLPAVGSNTPGHGYATLTPGSPYDPNGQFDIGSDIVIPMKSRKGILFGIGGVVLLLILGLILTSGGDEEPKSKAGAEDETEEEGTPAEVPVAPPVEPKTPEEIAADKAAAEKAAAEKAAADKKAAAAQAAADKLAAQKAIADKKAADKLAAAEAAAAKQAEAAKIAEEKKAAAAAAREAKKLAAAQRAAERKAAAAARAAKNPKGKKKPPKWDPNSPFAPQ